MDADEIFGIGFFASVVVFFIGIGTLIYLGERGQHEFALACLQAGKQVIEDNCIEVSK